MSITSTPLTARTSHASIEVVDLFLRQFTATASLLSPAPTDFSTFQPSNTITGPFASAETHRFTSDTSEVPLRTGIPLAGSTPTQVPVGAIAGGVSAAIVAFLVCSLVVWRLRKKNSKNRELRRRDAKLTGASLLLGRENVVPDENQSLGAEEISMTVLGAGKATGSGLGWAKGTKARFTSGRDEDDNYYAGGISASGSAAATKGNPTHTFPSQPAVTSKLLETAPSPEKPKGRELNPALARSTPSLSPLEASSSAHGRGPLTAGPLPANEQAQALQSQVQSLLVQVELLREQQRQHGSSVTEEAPPAYVEPTSLQSR